MDLVLQGKPVKIFVVHKTKQSGLSTAERSLRVRCRRAGCTQEDVGRSCPVEESALLPAGGRDGERNAWKQLQGRWGRPRHLAYRGHPSQKWPHAISKSCLKYPLGEWLELEIHVEPTSEAEKLL